MSPEISILTSAALSTSIQLSDAGFNLTLPKNLTTLNGFTFIVPEDKFCSANVTEFAAIVMNCPESKQFIEFEVFESYCKLN